MKKIILFIIFTCVILPVKMQDINIVSAKVPFAVGEEVKFDLNYLGITAGIAKIKIEDIVTVRGRKCYHIVSTADAIPPFSWIHTVKDKVESFMDVEKLCTLRLVKDIHEGGHKEKSTLEFYQDKNIVKDGDKEIAVPEGVQDILSAFYYFRTKQVEVGKSLSVNVYADGKVHNFTVKIMKNEDICTSAGLFKNAFIIEPVMDFKTVFKQEGTVSLWVSNDKWLMPVYMKCKVFVGSIRADLTSISLVESK